MTRFPNDDRDLRDRLRSLRVDPAPGDFEASLRQRLVAAGPPEEAGAWRRLTGGAARRAVLWPAAAGLLAAVLLVGLGFMLMRPAPERERERERGGIVTLLPATKVAVVRLNLSTDVAVAGAHVRVELPPELSFWADGTALPQRSFEWIQPLEAGNNEIPIAVRGQQPGRYRIAVRARIGDQIVDEQVLLEVVEG